LKQDHLSYTGLVLTICISSMYIPTNPSDNEGNNTLLDYEQDSFEKSEAYPHVL